MMKNFVRDVVDHVDGLTKLLVRQTQNKIPTISWKWWITFGDSNKLGYHVEFLSTFEYYIQFVVALCTAQLYNRYVKINKNEVV